jgi:hypothetical protein
VAKKSEDPDRKARIEKMRREQAAADRRRTMLVVGSAVLVIVVLAGIVTKVVLDAVADQDMANVGVATAAASCDAVVTDPAAASGTAVHVGTGTPKPDVTKVDYPMIPPDNGEHFATPVYPAAEFYTPQDRPVLERLVHNLEHGYTVVWYTSATPKAQQDQLRKIATLARKDEKAAGKFIVSSWDDSRGAFPGGKTIGFSHWGAKSGHRQLCGSVSGAAVKKFIDSYPYTDSPEPNGQ